jgi:hypothetical protein
MSIKNSGKERIRKKFVFYKNLGRNRLFFRTVWVKEVFDGTRWRRSQILKEKPKSTD